MATIVVDPISSPRIITVPGPDVEISIQDLVNLCRTWEDDHPGMGYPHLINAAGKENLGGGVQVGITATLQNAVLAFEARSGPSYIQCRISGGNLVAIDDVGADISPVYPTAFTQVVLANSSSATTQSQEILETSVFNEAVTIDPLNGTDGTSYPIGTPSFPVKNITDAVLIAENYGFKKFIVKGQLNVDSQDFGDGYEFRGESPLTSVITLQDLTFIDNCSFSRCQIAGVLDNGNIIEDAIVNYIQSFNGFIYNSAITGPVKVSGAGQTSIINCWSNIAGNNTPVLDVGTSPLAIRNYSGGIEITNKTSAADFSADITSGQIIIDSTCTAGDLYIRGNCKITDNSTGTCNVINETGTYRTWEEPKALSLPLYMGLK